jgi:D-3-phosphoglycerate dehydrogenase/C-terminal binding protein
MPSRPKVVVTDFLAGSLDLEREILGDLADLVGLNAECEEDLVGQIEDADAVMVYHVIALTEKTISRLKRCKLIVRCGVGYDNVDGRAARARGIDLTNVPDYGTEEVADSAIGMTLALARGISVYNSLLRPEGAVWSYQPAAPIHRLRGRVFGIVGLGRIGSAAALRAKALGMDVVFYDPYIPDGRDKALGVRRAESLDELLSIAQVLSLHCPLTAETHQLVNAATIARLPQGSLVINTARGAVVDTTAIPDAVASGQLAGAGIDVFDIEPPAADHPLMKAWRDPTHPAFHRVLINPHAAFYSVEGLREMRVKGSQSCRRALLGLPQRNVVN